ncbi:chaperonin [Archangium sp.]|uniref:chaperonin n=1 Tax=Archangium sp. TaxID=1872627 RepID=UPI00389A339E
MAKTQRRGQVMNRVARQVKGTAGRAVAKAKASKPVRKVQVTLGDLIAAAFDVAGEAKAAAKLVSSRAMSEATGKQIVVVG